MSHGRKMSVTLSRGMGLMDVTMIGVGAMIGAGIFGLTGIAAGEAGPVGLLLAFFLNGIITSLTGLTYAELGSAIPEAGGGYLWVRHALSRFWGFFAGWISWFSHSVACSLYAVIFGTFFVELLKLGNIHFSETPIFLGLSVEDLAIKVFALLVVALFMYVNLKGASETGTVGNVVTIFKIVVLLVLVGFGIKAMMNIPNWPDHFLRDPSPFPHGIWGVFGAMGLTFVAFEGYEIIAQSGEELKDPGRNLPKAIFYSIVIVVAIYLLVAFVAVGALTHAETGGLPAWVYLGKEGDRAMIRLATHIMPYGTLIMILGGLASTISALNATVYSSSRVSFAMGRGGDLPALFGKVHPRNRTPHMAILFSGLLIGFMAVALPVADVASGASLTFLMLFLLTNISLIQLRKTQPDLERPFKVPWVPALPILAIAVQGFLAVDLLRASPIAWGATILWILLGIYLFRRWGGREEAQKEADTILLEETIAERRFSILVPVVSATEGREIAKLGAMLSYYYDGELFALHVVRVPHQLSLHDGRAFLKQGRPLLEAVVEVGQEYDVPVRTQLRLGRKVARSIVTAAQERHADLMLLHWPGYSDTRDAHLGSIIDAISSNPPCDLAVVRLVKPVTPPRRILVPVAGGPHTQLAVEIAVAQAVYTAEKTLKPGDPPPQIVALHLVPRDGDMKAAEERQRALMEQLTTITDFPVELRILPGDDVVQGVLSYAKERQFEQIVIGASEEGFLEQAVFGTIPQRIAQQAEVNVIMVKRYNPIKHGLLGRLKRNRETR